MEIIFFASYLFFAEWKFAFVSLLDFREIKKEEIFSLSSGKAVSLNLNLVSCFSTLLYQF